MRILMLNYEYPPLGGGGSKQSMFLARELAKKHELYFLTAGYKNFGVYQENGYTVHKLKTSRKRKLYCSNREMLSYVVQAWKELPKIIKSFRPEIVHAYFAVPTGLLFFHPLIKMPCLVSLRGSDVPNHNPDRFSFAYPLITPIVKKIWKRSRKVISNSIALKKEALEILPELKIKVIPNGIDTDRFKPKEKQNKNITLLYVGRLISLKRIDVLIRLIPKLKNVKLVLVGSGPQEQYLKSLAKKLKISDRVAFRGNVDFSKIHLEFQKADIYVQLSKTEGMSNTILEAMACGLPVLVTDVGNNNKLVKNNGYIVKADNTTEILMRLNNLICDDKLRKQMGEQSRKIAEKYSWNNVSAQYYKLYRT